MEDNKKTTSFIPKKPIQMVSSGGGIRKRRPYNIFNVLATIIFLGTIAIFVALFFYNKKLETDYQNQVKDLKSRQENFDRQFINVASRLDNRIKGVEKILTEHLAPSLVFTILEEGTIKTVKFNNFNYKIDADGDVVLTGSGIAKDFESIAQQSDEYAAPKIGMKGIIFSGLQKTQQDLVTFSFGGVISPKRILYSDRIANARGEQNNNTENNEPENADSTDDTEAPENTDSVDNTDEVSLIENSGFLTNETNSNIQ